MSNPINFSLAAARALPPYVMMGILVYLQADVSVIQTYATTFPRFPYNASREVLHMNRHEQTLRANQSVWRIVSLLGICGKASCLEEFCNLCFSSSDCYSLLRYGAFHLAQDLKATNN